MCTKRKKIFCYTNCRLYRNKNEFYQTSTLKNNFASSFLYPVNFSPFKYLEKKLQIKTILPFFLRPKTVVSFKAISIKIFYQICFLFYRTAFASLLFYLLQIKWSNILVVQTFNKNPKKLLQILY